MKKIKKSPKILKSLNQKVGVGVGGLIEEVGVGVGVFCFIFLKFEL